MARSLFSILVLLPFVLQPLSAIAEDSAPTCDIAGVAIDSEKDPVADAEVTLVTTASTVRTDGDGRFRFAEVPAGTVELIAVAEGFSVAGDRFDCPAAAEIEIEVPMQPAFGEVLVVTGTRTEKRLAEVAVHTQVIPRKDIEMTASRTLADAVEYTSGLRVESNCQNCNFSQIRMLGLEGPYSQVLIDGMPSVSSLAMVYGIEQLPARMIDSIEVVKGGGSATYGAGSVGGVINLIPHQPSRTAAEVQANYLATGGEPGYTFNGVGDWLSGDGQRAASLFGQLDRIEPVDVDGDGFSEVSQRKLLAVGGRFEQYAFDSRGRLVGEANYTREDRRGGDLVNFDRPPSETELTEATDSRRVGISAAWLHQATAKMDYRATTSLARMQRDSYYGAGFDPNAYGTTDNPLWILDGQVNRYFRTSTLTAGAAFQQDSIEDSQPAYDRFIEESYQNIGAFVQDDRKIGESLNLLYGARVDAHSEIDDPIVSPRVALMWAPKANWTVRASYATGFRPPAVFDEDLHILVAGGEAQVIRNDPDLVEESSRGYLLGTEWRPTFAGKGSAAVFLNLFRTDLEDLFNVVEADDPTTPEVEFLRVNQGEARVQGVELSGSVRWGTRLSADFGLVSQTSRFAEPEPDFGSLDFFRTPDLYGSLGVIWQATQKLDVFSGLIYTGPMKVPHYAGYIEEDRLEITQSFLTFDINVSRRIDLGTGFELKVTAGVKNLTNEFQPDLDQGPDRDSGYVYGPRFPRSYVVGVTAGF